MARQESLRALELYCGIGGLSAAAGSAVDVVAAIDINRNALAVYEANFPHPTVAATLESISAEQLQAWRADLWWMSPPCQPFTRRGAQRDHQDPRTHSLLSLIDRLKEVRPRYLALENVPEFDSSETHGRLVQTLDELDYDIECTVLCPTELGLPNRRRRFYLVAGREPLRRLQPQRHEMQPLTGFLDSSPDPALAVDARTAERYRHALHVVEADDPTAVTSCFTSAYGHSPVRSGSYLRDGSGLRRFSPHEILRLLGFPADFKIPRDMSLSSAWRLVGNSLSIPAVRTTLWCVPQLVEFTDRKIPHPISSP